VKKNGSVVATLVYDGDGQRVKTTFGSTTTVYVGGYYEQQGSTIRKYYYAGGQRMAMRVGTSTVYYLLVDHLGSTAITANSSGTRVAELRYYAYGGTRYTYGTTPTAYKFTGQRLDDSTGLYYYGARYYDPVLGRLVQADTIVPDPGNPQALNRYAYVLNWTPSCSSAGVTTALPHALAMCAVTPAVAAGTVSPLPDALSRSYPHQPGRQWCAPA